MTVAAVDIPAQDAPGRGWAGRLGGALRFMVGVLLCLTPATAVLALGWIARRMRAEEAAARARLSGQAASAAPVYWAQSDRADARGAARWFGGLWANLRAGLGAAATLAAGTAAFTALWLLSWWAGWENSFNKGYEQAWVGPTAALVGLAASAPLLALLPMSLAHQAVKGRMSAFFAWGQARRLIAAAGWRYVALSIATVLAASPLWAFQVLPAFAETWAPGLSASDPAEVEAFKFWYRLAATLYMFSSLLALRLWAARLHARASLRLAREEGRRRSGVAHIGAAVRTAVLLVVWLGLGAQVFVAQFASHSWIAWAQHPFWGLPWLVGSGW